MTAQMAGLLAGTTGLLVDGQWEPGRADFAVLDKYTQQQIAAVAQAGPADVGRAVTGALPAAQRPLPPARRQATLAEAARLLDERRDEIRALYVAETGFTPADAATELTRAVATLRLSAEEAVRIAGREIPVAATPGSEHRLAFTIRVPVGVVAAITPFNAPLNTTAHKVGPAIAAGNAVVLKPAEQTPLCSVALAQALLDAGLPPGFLQLVCGPGESTGAALVADRRVRFFTFTGSAAVGLAIKQNSGIAKTHLELGSNSASIVAADADLDLVAELAVRAGYRKAGQVCTSLQRLLVHESVADELAARLAKRVAGLRAGDPRDPAVQVGPLIAPAEAERAQRWIQQAARRGAAVLVGGERDGPVLAPALLRDPPPDSRIMTEEIFAPAVALAAVASLDEAIGLVNASEYGLQAGVFIQDLDAAFYAARRLRVGGVMINDTSSYHADAMPYGGVKDSGYGLEGPRYAGAGHDRPADHRAQPAGGPVTMPLSGCSFGWLHLAPLPDALRALARHGFGSIELTAAPPHLSAPTFGPYERQELNRLLNALDLRVLSVNPSFADINLVSTNPEFRELSERQLLANIELAADLGAEYVVVIPGRRHALAPAPDDATRAVLDQGLHRLLARADQLGVTLALENSPYGYLGRASDLAEIAADFDSPRLRLTYDVANALAIEDPADGVRQAAKYLALAHVSDTWRDTWAHTAAGTAEVDFGGFAAALQETGFAGPTVYELVDGLDPEPRLPAGLATLAAAGWTP